MKCEKCEDVELQVSAASAAATVYRCPACGSTTTVLSDDKKKEKRTKPEK